MTQYEKIRAQLKMFPRNGRTALELIVATGSTCPHKRIAEMQCRGEPIVEFWAKRKGQDKQLRAWKTKEKLK